MGYAKLESSDSDAAKAIKSAVERIKRTGLITEAAETILKERLGINSFNNMGGFDETELHERNGWLYIASESLYYCPYNNDKVEQMINKLEKVNDEYYYLYIDYRRGEPVENRGYYETLLISVHFDLDALIIAGLSEV